MVSCSWMDDPMQMQQVELRDVTTIKAKTNPKPLDGRLYNLHILLPLFIIIVIIVIIILLIVSYFLPGLGRCYFCPVSISCAELVSLLANKKALFLFSNFIFILLAVDFTLSTPSNSFASTLHNDNSASLEAHVPSDSNAILLVGDAPAVAEQLHDESRWISSSLQVQQVISLEQKSTISDVDDSFAEEKKLAKEESKTNTGMICGVHIEWRRRPAEYSNRSQQGRRMKTVERGGHVPTLELVVVDGAIGKERTELEAFGIEDELEHLELDELNRKFDEFIARKKNKWRSEALQLVTAV